MCAAHNAAPRLFRDLLTYKAASAGAAAVAVNPQRASQVCSGCGQMAAKSLLERIHDCPHRHLRMDRGKNPARNTLAFALAFASARTGPSGANVAGCGARSLRSCPLSVPFGH
ncbi:MAG: zinc ribbon domain-containing protein [Aggregatilineales bacterium]